MEPGDRSSLKESLQSNKLGRRLHTATIELGSPWQNGFAESFFSRLRDELLTIEEFMNMKDARWFAKRRLHEHNEERPHSSLGYRTPSQFASQLADSTTASATPQPPFHQPTAETVSQPVLS